MGKYLRKVFIFLPILIMGLGKPETQAQVKVKAVPFTFFPDQIKDQYNERLTQKTIMVNASDFIILSRSSETGYRLGYFKADLKQSWQTAIPVAENEDIEAFTFNNQNALVLKHQNGSATGNQSLYAHLVDLKTGAQVQTKKILEAPAKSRRIDTAISPDGAKLIAYQYIYQQDQLKAIEATIYDANLNKLKEQIYSLRDLVNLHSAQVQIDNAGNVFLFMSTNKATRLLVRRYNLASNEPKSLDAQVGGLFDGRTTYMLHSKLILQPDDLVYAAVICADEKTGEYQSLKIIKFDFKANDLVLAPAFKFTLPYLADINKLRKPGEVKVNRLEDIYLSDLIVTPDNQLLVIAEKKYNEGPKLPFVAKEMHLFAYDEFINPTWHAIINKNQAAPATEGFSSISYKSQVFGDNFYILTLETHTGKTDLFNRKINIKTGATSEPKAMGLNFSREKNLIYLKDFTAWLNEKNIITIIKPAQKPALWQLSKLTFK